MRSARNGIVGAAVRDGGLDTNKREISRFDSLAAILTEVKRGRLSARKEHSHTLAVHDRTRAHFKTSAVHRGEMAMQVLQIEAPITPRDKRRLDCDRPRISAPAASADGKPALLPRLGIGERGDGHSIVNRNERVVHAVRPERAENPRAVAGRATADVIGRLDE